MKLIPRSTLPVLLLLAVCQLLVTAPAQENNPDKQLSVVTLNWEPFYAESLPDGGLVSDIVRSSFAHSGYQVNIKFIPWDRALDTSAKAKDDVLMGLWFAEERTSIYHFSEPFLANRLVFVKAADDPFEFEGLDSLHGKRVGTVRKYVYLKEFLEDPEIRKFPVSSLTANLRKVAAGRVDLTLDDEIVIKDLINRQLPELKDKLSLTRNALEEKPLYIASSLKHPRGAEIIAAFNKGLQQIRANGEYETLLKKHGFD